MLMITWARVCILAAALTSRVDAFSATPKTALQETSTVVCDDSPSDVVQQVAANFGINVPGGCEEVASLGHCSFAEAKDVCCKSCVHTNAEAIESRWIFGRRRRSSGRRRRRFFSSAASAASSWLSTASSTAGSISSSLSSTAQQTDSPWQSAALSTGSTVADSASSGLSSASSWIAPSSGGSTSGGSTGGPSYTSPQSTLFPSGSASGSACGITLSTVFDVLSAKAELVHELHDAAVPLLKQYGAEGALTAASGIGSSGLSYVHSWGTNNKDVIYDKIKDFAVINKLRAALQPSLDLFLSPACMASIAGTRRGRALGDLEFSSDKSAIALTISIAASAIAGPGVKIEAEASFRLKLFFCNAPRYWGVQLGYSGLLGAGVGLGGAAGGVAIKGTLSFVKDWEDDGWGTTTAMGTSWSHPPLVNKGHELAVGQNFCGGVSQNSFWAQTCSCGSCGWPSGFSWGTITDYSYEFKSLGPAVGMNIAATISSSWDFDWPAEAANPPAICSQCAPEGCEAACNEIGKSAGRCLHPDSTDPDNCCECSSPSYTNPHPCTFPGNC